VVCIREGNTIYRDLNIDTLIDKLKFTPLTPYFSYYKNKLETYTKEIRNYEEALGNYKKEFNKYTAKQGQLNKETIRLNKCSKNFFKKITNSCKNIKKAVKRNKISLPPPTRPTMPTLDSSLQNEMALIKELSINFTTYTTIDGNPITSVKSQTELNTILTTLHTIIESNMSPFTKGIFIWYGIKNSFKAYKEPVIPTTNPGNTHKYNMFLFNTNFKENQNTASIIYQSIQVLLNNNDILYDVYKAHPEIKNVDATDITIKYYLFIKDNPTFNITISTIINLIKTTVVNLKSDLDIL
jgi:hypothetical protein